MSSKPKSRDEILSQNVECYITDYDKDPNANDIKLTSTPKQKKATKQISASEPSKLSTQNSPFMPPSPIKLREQSTSSSFTLFDDFTFSLTSPTMQEDQGWAASFEQLRLGTENENGNLRNGWVDDFAPQFSNSNREGEESGSLYAEPSKVGVLKDGGIFSSMLQDKGFPERGKVIGSINPPNTSFQPVIWPEKEFPFHQPGTSSVVPNAIQCDYAPTPGICVIPHQIPYVEPWLLDNRAFFCCNQYQDMLTSCPACMEESTYSNVHWTPEFCNFSCCNQHVRINEIQTEECIDIQEDLEDQQQTEATYQPQATFKGRRQNSKADSEKPKSARKIQSVLKVNQRRRKHSKNQDIAEQNDFVSKPVEQVSKSARPILSAKK